MSPEEKQLLAVVAAALDRKPAWLAAKYIKDGLARDSAELEASQ